jgi:N-ethylmaleimide reductase
MPSLFDPIKLGAVTAPNRVFMAPLTRARGTRDHVPNALMKTYYEQRAGAGLIITEATGISPQGLGWPFAPGIWSTEQVEGWKPITQAVHDRGGRIFCQLWHMGRLVHPSYLDGQPPVSSSVTQAPDLAHTYHGKQPYAESRALSIDEIAAIVADYGRAAGHAIAAGFDGVQLHGANGYLIDQFLRDNCNFRTDQYGGSIENRTRLLREVTQAIADVVGPERTSVRLSPNGEIQGVNDSNPEPLFVAAAEALAEIGIAFLEVREPHPESALRIPDHPPIAPKMRKVFPAPLVLNSEYTLERAQAALDAGEADAVSFGRSFIANPDLPQRLEAGSELNKPDPMTFYSQGPEGYVDYPALEAQAA